MESSLDLNAYLARIGYTGSLSSTPEVLTAIHLAHASSVPFENLDILLGRPIRIDLDSIQAKIVRARRGGYCFEQNTLLAAVLERLGFSVTRLAARVRVHDKRITARTHMLLRVETDGGSWLADVGFGTGGTLVPIRLVAGSESRHGAWRHRIVHDATLWVLQELRPDGWRDLYAFTLEPQYPIDFELANHYTSTHPNSRFTQTLVAQRMGPQGRSLLVNRNLTVELNGTVDTRTVRDDDELLNVLKQNFGLDFPTGTRFRLPSVS
jgi:N-hydroxyarylamine O-acetyltransferase